MEQLPDTNPYRQDLAASLHAIEKQIEMEMPDIVLIMMSLNTEEKIVRFREELRLSLDQAREWVKRVEEGLAVLTPEERLVLDRFFIHPEKGAADRLAGDLHLDVKTVYRRKDAALLHFTISLYGGVES